MSDITVHVKALDGSVVDVQCPPTTTVPDFKALIAGKKPEVPVGDQRLIHRGRVLKDDKSLNDYNLVDGQTLHLVGRPPARDNASAGASGSGSGTADNSNTGRRLPDPMGAAPPQQPHQQPPPPQPFGGVNLGEIMNSVLTNIQPMAAQLTRSIQQAQQNQGQQPPAPQPAQPPPAQPAPAGAPQFRGAPGVVPPPGTPGMPGAVPGPVHVQVHALTHTADGHTIPGFPPMTAPEPNGLPQVRALIDTLGPILDSANLAQLPTPPTTAPPPPPNSAGLTLTIEHALALMTRLTNELPPVLQHLRNEQTLTDVNTRNNLGLATNRIGSVLSQFGYLLTLLGQTMSTATFGTAPGQSSIFAPPPPLQEFVNNGGAAAAAQTQWAPTVTMAGLTGGGLQIPQMFPGNVPMPQQQQQQPQQRERRRSSRSSRRQSGNDDRSGQPPRAPSSGASSSTTPTVPAAQPAAAQPAAADATPTRVQVPTASLQSVLQQVMGAPPNPPAGNAQAPSTSAGAGQPAAAAPPAGGAGGQDANPLAGLMSAVGPLMGQLMQGLNNNNGGNGQAPGDALGSLMGSLMSGLGNNAGGAGGASGSRANARSTPTGSGPAPVTIRPVAEVADDDVIPIDYREIMDLLKHRIDIPDLMGVTSGRIGCLQKLHEPLRGYVEDKAGSLDAASLDRFHTNGINPALKKNMLSAMEQPQVAQALSDLEGRGMTRDALLTRSRELASPYLRELLDAIAADVATSGTPFAEAIADIAGRGVGHWVYEIGQGVDGGKEAVTTIALALANGIITGEGSMVPPGLQAMVTTMLPSIVVPYVDAREAEHRARFVDAPQSAAGGSGEGAREFFENVPEPMRTQWRSELSNARRSAPSTSSDTSDAYNESCPMSKKPRLGEVNE